MNATGVSSIDALWDELAPHLEWPEGLSLVLLFAGHPGPVGELKERFEQSLRDRGRGLKVLDPLRAEEIEALVANVLSTPDADCGGLWVSLLRQAGAPGWSEAVKGLLQRLNERRFLLERDVGVPLVLVLPLEIRSEFHWLAPDLWTVRSFAERVPGPKVARRTRGPENKKVEGFVTTLGRAEREWLRLQRVGEPKTLDVHDGFLAFRSAMDRGDLQGSRRIALETLALSLHHLGTEVEDTSDFDVAEALERANLGDGWTEPNLPMALVMIGEVESKAGRLPQAREFFQSSLDIFELQRTTNPHRGTSINVASSLQKLGDVEFKMDRFEAARELFQRSLELRELRVVTDPDDVAAHWDLSLSRRKLGDVEVQLGNFEAAREFLIRSLEVLEAQGKANPGTPQRSLAVAKVHVDLAGVAEYQGDLGQSRKHLHQARTTLEAMDVKGSLASDREALLRDVLRRLS